MKETLISIIIVSYNSQDVIDDCLRSIQENNDIGDRLEIIVVEQSRDEQLFRDLTERYPDITVLRAENRGFGAGNNFGAEYAHGEILFFLNPDTIIEEPLFSFLEQQLQQDPRIGLAGVKLLSERGENISYNMCFPYGLKAKLKYVLYRKIDRFASGQMYIEGADLIIRKEVFHKINGFDEQIFMYFEEMDICYRIQKAGYRIQYFPDKKIRHLQGKCTEGRYPAIFSKQLDSFIYVSRKHGFDYQKWLKREQRYQRFRSKVMRILGRKGQADLSDELSRIAGAGAEK